ncbi:restriction endonuclease subunit S [Citrobacter portucalensis]|uniref:restriction endonuclease subunit S n=1 Tax=Citrobacter portucalensis TaxID=1639133 RepID=UPI003336AF74
MAKYKAYPEYKTISNSWLDSIPKGWELLPLKYLCTSFVKDGPHETPVFLEEGVPFLSVDGIQNNKLVFEGCRYISPSDHYRFSQKCKPVKGDVLLGKAASIGKVALVDTSIEFNVWSPLAVITPIRSCLSKFIYYSFQTTMLQAQCEVYSNSNTQKNLGMNTIDNLDFAMPSDKEASTISNFLDHEIAKIDNLIEKQNQLIDLLKEKRQAVISHAVTKGLNPDVPMKDSGVEWLGEVPAHWKVSKLKYFASIQGGFAFSSDSFTHEGVQILRIGNLYQNNLELERQPIFLDVNELDRFRDFVICKDDILMSLTGTLGKRDYGFAIKVDRDDVFLLNQRVAKITPDETRLCRDFLLYILWSDSYLNQLYSLPSGTKQANLSNSNVTDILVACPAEISEQKSIIEMVTKQMEVFDSLMDNSLSLMESLQERRTALISAAVTGKIDVRDWVAPDTQDVEEPQEATA